MALGCFGEVDAIVAYANFLASKRPEAPDAGFEVTRNALPAALFDWRAAVVRWGLRRGRAALFEDTGLGKTAQQLAWALRDALGVGATSLEELSDTDDSQRQSRPAQGNTETVEAERTRGGATRKAAGKLWHLVKGSGNGVGFEEEAGKAIQDMSAQEVSEWINRLS